MIVSTLLQFFLLHYTNAETIYSLKRASSPLFASSHITAFTQDFTPFLIMILLSIALAIVIRLFYKKKSTLEEIKQHNETLKTQIEGFNRISHDRENELRLLKEFIYNQKNEIEIIKGEHAKALKVAQEADMLKSNFLANMSHEIRTPMNGIMGFAQMLQDDNLEKDRQQRYLDIIYYNGNMLVNLIDDIIDIAKIEAGQLIINKSEVNLDDLIFELYTFFNEIKFKQEKEHLIIRVLNINDDENNVLVTDGNRVRQVMVNLIGNAIKFTDSGTVEFGYINNIKDGNIQFFVRDTGIGIPENMQDIIFERFRQVEEGMSRKYGGIGIGLFISNYIVNLLGGKIWVESQLDKGTAFYFTVPYELMQQSDLGKTIFHTSKRQYNWIGKVIVVAEDIDTNYLLIKSFLDGTQVQLIWARDGEEVIKICEENHRVDMVLMDIQMPKLNGYDTTQVIKNLNPEIIVIAHSAYAMPNDNIKCMEVGCDDYISKPLDSEQLLKKIDFYLSAKVR